jgi:hypothetical protein
MKVLMIGTGWTVFDDERRDGLMRLWVDGWDLNVLDECNYDGIIQNIENMMMIPIPLWFISNVSVHIMAQGVQGEGRATRGEVSGRWASDAECGSCKSRIGCQPRVLTTMEGKFKGDEFKDFWAATAVLRTRHGTG